MVSVRHSMEGGSMSTVPTAKAQVRVHIRWMIRRDMPEVLAIEHASFEYPWCEEEFLRVLRQRVGHQMVAKLVGKLSSHRRTRIALSVRETNLPAQLFFRIQGFRALE